MTRPVQTMERALEVAVQNDPAAQALAAEASVLARHFTADEFFEFAEGHFTAPSADSASNTPLVALDWQRAELTPLMLLDARGRLTSATWILSWPRRHGKTQWAGYYTVARCLVYPNQVCVVEANAEHQAEDTAFFWVLQTIRNSPSFALRGDPRQRKEARRFRWKPAAKAGEPARWWAAANALDVTITDGEVRFGNGSVIRLVTSEEASSYGGKLSVYLRTELHAAPSTGSFDGRSGSTLDSWCGVTIVDSTQGEEGGVLDRMTRDGKLAAATGGAQGDAMIAVSHVHYQDIDHACEGNLAPWIDALKLRSLAARMPGPSFRRNHLNLATTGGESVFDAALLRRACNTPWSPLLCRHQRPGWSGDFTSRADFKALRRMFRGHGLAIGLGLDRSMGVLRGDRTVVSVVGVGVDESRIGQSLTDEHDETLAEYERDPRIVLTLALVAIPRGFGSAIRKLIRVVERLYGQPAMAFEAYQAKDLADWAEGEGYTSSARAMTAQAKATHVQRYCELLADDRLALPSHAAQGRGWAGVHFSELTRYAETESKGALPSYGGASALVDIDLKGAGARPVRIKDDCVESQFWALEAVWETDPTDDGGLSV
ncbi:MAG: hypothetical protein KF684_04165 [Phycisphaeraceae bacterium]|nr:hypothetical protein [Phycisphaeraceae bacterium]